MLIRYNVVLEYLELWIRGRRFGSIFVIYSVVKEERVLSRHPLWMN